MMRSTNSTQKRRVPLARASVFVIALAGAAVATEPVAIFPTADLHQSVPRHTIFELSVTLTRSYSNKFRDVQLEAVFTSPGGRKQHRAGFFYAGDVWKVRFAPDEVGPWRYGYALSDTSGWRADGDGAFDCVASTQPGPLRRHPRNPHRWTSADSRPYFPVGLQDCVRTNGAQLRGGLIDGGDRGNARRVTWQEYFTIYADAGFDLFRFSQRNCSFLLFDDLDQYREAESLATDALLDAARGAGFRVMFGIFGFHATYPPGGRLQQWFTSLRQVLFSFPAEGIQRPNDLATLRKEQRFIDYAVARWGVYTDFWELLNERRAHDEWIERMAGHVRLVDPDGTPVTSSPSPLHLSGIDVNAPHWYESEGEHQGDLRVAQQADEWKAAGKPVIVGEHGNLGMNWDPRSAMRMRIRAWAALFNEIALVFWNTSYSRAGMFGGVPRPTVPANIYLGPEERSYIRVLRDFAVHLDADVGMTPVSVSAPAAVRAYGLASASLGAIYLHHFADHETAIDGVRVRLDGPVADPHASSPWRVTVIEPASGRRCDGPTLASRDDEFTLPAFAIDLAVLIHHP